MEVKTPIRRYRPPCHVDLFSKGISFNYDPGTHEIDLWLITDETVEAVMDYLQRNHPEVPEWTFLPQYN